MISLSKEFRTSLLIIIIFLFNLIVGIFLFKGDFLNVNLVSRLVLTSTIAIIFIYFLNKIRLNRPKCSKWNLSVIKYKFYSYIVIISITIFWSFLAGQLGAAFSDYTIDILIISPFIVLGLCIYSLWIDCYLKDSKDDYYYFGLYLSTGNLKKIFEDKLFILSILLKAQFLPFMYVITLGGIERILYIDNYFDLKNISMNLFILGIMFDVLIAFCGYIFTSKLLGHRIIDIDKNIFGWVVCLICYPPFYFLLQNIYSVFEHPVPVNWIAYSNFFSWIIIVFQTISWIIYWWATLEFGLKFSNLTWRGLVDTGPYKYFKHPAYLFKNLYWWLSLIPLLLVSPLEQSFKLFLGLLIVSFVYYCRAKCEEKHLRQFAEYKNYLAKFK